jgi:hypothetical protein
MLICLPEAAMAVVTVVVTDLETEPEPATVLAMEPVTDLEPVTV